MIDFSLTKIIVTYDYEYDIFCNECKLEPNILNSDQVEEWYKIEIKVKHVTVLNFMICDKCKDKLAKNLTKMERKIHEALKTLPYVHQIRHKTKQKSKYQFINQNKNEKILKMSRKKYKIV